MPPKPSGRARPPSGFFVNVNGRIMVKTDQPNGEDCNRQGGVPRIALNYRQALKDELPEDLQNKIHGLSDEIATLIQAKEVSADVFAICVLDDVIDTLINNKKQGPTQAEMNAMEEARLAKEEMKKAKEARKKDKAEIEQLRKLVQAMQHQAQKNKKVQKKYESTDEESAEDEGAEDEGEEESEADSDDDGAPPAGVPTLAVEDKKKKK
jgi:hypothetical protein